MSQIACKLSPKPKASVTNMRSEALFICPMVCINTILLPDETENTTFAIGREGRKSGPLGKKLLFYLLFLNKGLQLTIDSNHRLQENNHIIVPHREVNGIPLLVEYKNLLLSYNLYTRTINFSSTTW